MQVVLYKFMEHCMYEYEEVCILAYINLVRIFKIVLNLCCVAILLNIGNLSSCSQYINKAAYQYRERKEGKKATLVYPECWSEPAGGKKSLAPDGA